MRCSVYNSRPDNVTNHLVHSTFLNLRGEDALTRTVLMVQIVPGVPVCSRIARVLPVLVSRSKH